MTQTTGTRSGTLDSLLARVLPVAALLAALLTLAGPAHAATLGYQPAKYYQAGSDPQAVVSADFDGDGDADLATANTDFAGTANPDTISVLPGTGGGSFGAKKDYASGGKFPIDVASADFDGDGDRDLATLNYGAKTVAETNVSVLENNGNGAFAAPQSYNWPDPNSFNLVISCPYSVIATNLVGDAKPDLAVADACGPPDVHVLENDGSGAFSYLSGIGDGANVTDVAGGDFDGDGDNDLAAVDGFLDVVITMTNNGDGTFAAPVHHALPDNARHLVSADLNKDGKHDLAAHGFDLYVLMSQGASFAGAKTYNADKNTENLVSADLDGDGDTDVATANGTGDTVSVMANNGSGAFGLPRSFASVETPVGIAVADFDKDGARDLATANQELDKVGVLLGDTRPPAVVKTTPPAGATGVAPAANVYATFSEPVRKATVKATTFHLVKKGTTKKVAATVGCKDATCKTAVLNPSANLSPGATYVATVKGGAMGVKDPAGIPMAKDKVWGFTVRK